VVPPTLVGFAAINGFTFCADLLILTALHSHWGAPYAVAVGVGYAAAFALSFLLNRVLNLCYQGSKLVIRRTPIPGLHTKIIPQRASRMINDLTSYQRSGCISDLFSRSDVARCRS
jgi:hypothetical protein